MTALSCHLAWHDSRGNNIHWPLPPTVVCFVHFSKHTSLKLNFVNVFVLNMSTKLSDPLQQEQRGTRCFYGVYRLEGKEMKSARFTMFSTKVEIVGIAEIINHECKVKHCSHTMTHHKELIALHTITSSKHYTR